MTANKPPLRLLIVEDQIDLAENLYEFLGEDHYSLDFAADGLTALHLLAMHNYDVVVLDLMLPGVGGFDICVRIRQDLQCAVPIILMTSLSALSDKEKGFDCGADDYLVKPFELRELQLRVEALHRRHSPQKQILQAGEIRFDPGTLEVRLGELKTVLTGTPARLFELLIRAYPNFLSHETLGDALWGGARYGDTEGNSLRTHIYTLRRTLQSGLGHGLVKTVHGRGYRLESPEDTDRGTE
ncbi:DNA-binding response regulator ColR [Marinobacter salarius]|uniref:response regulator transcription factor n=1 Tax=Marinobacter salarius TaxID=1420917 RepID=UPI0012543345|nr:response regulator transcription factor [Marinobacter salarius]VVT32591.1 DNA-binding response regulator, OmpR family, contains REC and winged-helix (WHTH) domain [Marinobacter salarius]VXA93458.1 DNA-binding response regulator ColR [Marinobacter salarius]